MKMTSRSTLLNRTDQPGAVPHGSLTQRGQDPASAFRHPAVRAHTFRLALLIWAGTLVASAQVVSIDFKGASPDVPVATGDDGGTAFIAGQLGDWNILDVASSASPVAGPLLDGNGNASTLTFALNTTGATYAFYDTGDTDNLCRDVAYLSPGTSSQVQWEMGGLKPNAKYNLAFYAQRQNGVFNNPGVCTIGSQSRTNYDGTAVTKGVLFGNPDASENPESVTADADGKILGTFSFYEGPGTSGFSSWSGLQIVPTEKIVPPSAGTPTLLPSATIYAGTSVTLKTTGGGTPPLAYQWRLDAGSGAVNIPGATNASYTFPVKVDDQGAFDVVVTSPYGSATSAAAVLTVNPASAPLLISDTAPTAALSPLGGRAPFTAAYEGTLPIRYQWQVDKGQGFADVQGATNASLVLENLQSSQAGAYRLSASNSLGRGPESTAAVLDILTNVSLSVFTGPDPGQGLDLEGNFVTADYFGGTDAGPLQLGDAVFMFSDKVAGTGFEGSTPDFGSTVAGRNLAQICDSVRYGKTLDVVIDNAQSGEKYRLQLLFHEVYHGGAGARIMAVNIGGSDVVTNLDLVAMGANLKQPKGVALTYDFTSDGSPLLIPVLTIADNASLNAMTLENLSHPAPPSVISPPVNQVVYAGNNAQLVPIVSGSSPKTYQWQVGTNGVFTIVRDGGRIHGSTNGVLSIAGVTLADSAEYRVVIANGMGAVTSSPPATLSVLQRPLRQLVNVTVGSRFAGLAVLGQAPDVWNTVAGNNTEASALLDVTGTTTGLGLSIQGVSGGGSFGDGGLPVSPETAGLLSFYDYVAEGAMTVTLTGLDPNATYDLVVFSAGNQPGQSAVLSGAITGSNVLSTRAGFVLGDNYARNQSARSDNTGSLSFQITNDPNQTPYGTFNGLQLQNNQAAVRLDVQRSGESLLLSWPQGRLLEADAVVGPFLPVPGNQGSPYAVAPDRVQKFYRVQVSP